MNELFYKTPKNRNDISVRALEEKVKRLEQSLDREQRISGKPNRVADLETYNAALKQEIAISVHTNHRMRNCGNCNEEYCDVPKHTEAVQDCRENDHLHWQLEE